MIGSWPLSSFEDGILQALLRREMGVLHGSIEFSPA